eukprot:4296636-Alexandrium_andersonii.AAC.1
MGRINRPSAQPIANVQQPDRCLADSRMQVQWLTRSACRWPSQLIRSQNGMPINAADVARASATKMCPTKG